MTLSPDEARAAVREAEKAERRPVEEFGNELTALLLAGAGWAPVVLAVMAWHRGRPALWLLIGIVAGIAVLGATWMVSRKPSKADSGFSHAFLSVAALCAVQAVVYLGMVLGGHPSWQSVWLWCALLLVAPVAGCLSLMAVRAARRRH